MPRHCFPAILRPASFLAVDQTLLVSPLRGPHRRPSRQARRGASASVGVSPNSPILGEAIDEAKLVHHGKVWAKTDLTE